MKKEEKSVSAERREERRELARQKEGNITQKE